MMIFNYILFCGSLLAFILYIYNIRIFINKKVFLTFFLIVIFFFLVDIFFFNFAENAGFLQYKVTPQERNIFFSIFLMGDQNMNVDDAINLLKSYLKSKNLKFDKQTLLLLYHNNNDLFIKGFFRVIIFHVYDVNLPVDNYTFFMENCFSKQDTNLGINMTKICKTGFQNKNVPFSESELQKAHNILTLKFNIFCKKHNL